MIADRLTRCVAGALVVWTTSACSLKPPPDSAAIRDEARVPVDSADPWMRAAGSGEVADNWLVSFRDAQLTTLAAEAVTNNADLRVGAARVEQAAGYVRKAGAAIQPTIDAVGRYNTKFSGGLGSGLSGALLVAGWEIDLWGRVRYGRRAAVESYEAVVADREFARQSVAALTAKAWFTLTEALLLLDLSREQVEVAARGVEVAQKRFEVGVADERELNLSQANLSTFEEVVIQLEQARDDGRRALEVLLGRYPAAEIQGSPTLPDLPGPVPAGIPLQVLERRPDIIAAERRVASAFSRVGEAKAARLPAIGLTANLGVIASEVLDLKDDFSNPVGGVGGSFFAPLFRGGQLKANVDIAEAVQREAIANYAGRALRAISEVESNLQGGENLARRRDVLDDAVAANQRSLELEGIAFRIGRNDLRTVIQQQTILYASQVALINVRTLELVRRVDLHLALGGSFDEAPEAGEGR